jgi:RNA polymerase sigma-70 factor (ECF subfamily)
MTQAEMQIRLMECEHAIYNYVERRLPRIIRPVVCTEDILQEVWAAAYKSAGSFDPDGPDAVERWLYKIAHAILIDKIRASRSAKRGANGKAHRLGDHASSWLTFISRLAAPGRTPSSEQGAKDAISAVRAAVDTLHPDHRQAVVLHHVEGLSRAEVAKTMKKSPAAVHGMLFRGKAALRRALGPIGRYFSDDGIDETNSHSNEESESSPR